jgi:hypothetical protein
MLRRGVDLSVIALRLGHESTETTQRYLHADMQLKERALAHARPSGLKPAASGRRTPFWPFWKASDYADSRARKNDPPPSEASRSCETRGIIREAA